MWSYSGSPYNNPGLGAIISQARGGEAEAKDGLGVS